MPKFDDRFARQNRCEPPPEFPLASPYSGIVHHLSGPNSHAPTQIHPKTSGSVDDAPRGALTSVRFHCAHGFDTRTLAWMLDSLVRVSRRAAYDHYASIRAEARSSVPAGRIAPPAIRRPEGRHIPGAFDRPREPMLARETGSTRPRMAAEPRPRVWSQALPFQQFHVLFNSLFKVLLTFRSLYLFAIGLRPIFSFR